MSAKQLPPAAYLRECFAYNPITGVLTWRKRPRRHFTIKRIWLTWTTRYAMNTAGRLTQKGHIGIVLNGTTFFSHRIIWKLMTGREPLITIDHANGKPSDNRWRNLRAATIRQQSWNSRINKDNTSGYRGVSKIGNRWMVRIRTLNNERIYLGCYPTAAAAGAVYVAASRQLHGEFYRSGT